MCARQVLWQNNYPRTGLKGVHLRRQMIGTAFDEIIELKKILLIHGGTKQLPHLIRMIQAEGFIITVVKIPTEIPVDHDGVIFAGGTIPADNYQKVRFWSKRFIRNLTILPFLVFL